MFIGVHSKQCSDFLLFASLLAPRAQRLLLVAITSSLFMVSEGFPQEGPGLLLRPLQETFPVPTPHSVKVRGKLYDFVFLLKISNRLAAGEADLRSWGLLGQVGQPIQHGALSSASRFYWLDEISDVNVKIEGEMNRVTLLSSTSDRTIAKSDTADTQPTERDYAIRRGIGLDATIQGAFTTRAADSTLFQTQVDVGVSLGRNGRVLGVIDIGNDQLDTSDNVEKSGNRWKFHTRDIRYQMDTDTGYVFSAGELNSYIAGSHTGFEFAGVSWYANPLGISGRTSSSSYATVDNLAILQQPATLEIRVNGRLVATRNVGAGRLNLGNIPLDSGFNDIEVTVRYQDGRVELLNRKIARTLDLVDKGKELYSVEMGFMNQSTDISKRDYSSPYAAASFSTGASDADTLHLGTRFRAGDQQYFDLQTEWIRRLNGGYSFSAALAGSYTEGSNNTSGTESESSEQLVSQSNKITGAELRLDLQKLFDRSGVSLTATAASSEFRTLDAHGFTAAPLGSLQLNWRIATGTSQNISFSYRADEFRSTSSSDESTSSIDAGYTRQSAAIGFSAGSHRLQYQARVGYYDESEGSGFEGTVRLRIPFGQQRSRVTLGRSESDERYRQSVRVNRSLQNDSTGFSWAAELIESGKSDDLAMTSGYGRIFLRSKKLQSEATASYNGQNWYYSGGYSSSIVYSKGKILTSYPLGNSFVVVNAGEGAGAGLLANGRRIGDADESGDFLIASVPSYSRYNISLAPETLESNAVVEQSTINTRFGPGLSHIVFPVRLSQQAKIRLLDDKGDPWPAGSVLTLAGGGDDNAGAYRGIVGKNGLAYLIDLTADETLIVDAGNRRCELSISLSRASTDVVDLGDTICF